MAETNQTKNVRFFAGSKKQYLDLGSHSTLALYFCHDTRELFWGDMLISDGLRVVAKLPEPSNAADGVIYFDTETRNGYVLSSDRATWIQVINAASATSNVKAISFAGIEMEEVDGVFTIDRRCAREALGIIVPEGLEDKELEIATKDFVREEIAKIELGDITVNLENYYTKEQTEKAIEDAIDGIDIPEIDLNDYATKNELFSGDYNDLINKPEIPDVTGLASTDFVQQEIGKLNIPDVGEFITEEEVDAKGFLTEHDLDTYATKAEIENLATTSYVNDQIGNITTNYVTNQTLANYTTTEQLQATYVSNTTLADMNYITTTEATTQITQLVEEKVQEAVTPDAISYGDF